MLEICKQYTNKLLNTETAESIAAWDNIKLLNLIDLKQLQEFYRANNYSMYVKVGIKGIIESKQPAELPFPEDELIEIPYRISTGSYSGFAVTGSYTNSYLTTG
jgi:hypothetical protein